MSMYWVYDLPNLLFGTLTVAIFVVIGLVGLFIARAWPFGSLHYAGLGLFVVSGIVVFLDIKRVFDRINARPR